MSDQRSAAVTLAWRAGWRYGVAACVGTALDLGVQRLRHVLGWPPATTTWLNWVALAFPLVLVFIVGYRVGRAHGDVKLGAWGGAFAGALPAALFGLATAVVTIVAPPRTLPPPENLKTALLILAMGPVFGALFGFFLASVPAWVGRLVFRRHDPHYIARREARRRLSPAERRKKWLKDNLLPAVGGLGIAGLYFFILFLPDFIATWVRGHIPGWRVTLAIGAVALSVTLFVAFRKHRYVRIGTNWLAFFLLSLSLMLGFAGARTDWKLTGTSWALTFTRLVIPMMSTLFLLVNGVSATMSRPLREIAENLGEDQPLPPVYFHDGGARLVYYPSRRTLALHLLFSGALSLLFLAILFFPTVPPVIRWGTVLFGVMALIFGVGHDLVRLLVRWPALVVSGEGIIDQGSVGLYGFGLIPWSQIEGFFATRANLRHGRFAEVHLVARHEDRLIAAQPLYRRPLLRLMARHGFTIPLSAIVLSEPPEQIVEQIMAYVKRYGPATYANAFTENGAQAGEPQIEVGDD